MVGPEDFEMRAGSRHLISSPLEETWGIERFKIIGNGWMDVDGWDIIVFSSWGFNFEKDSMEIEENYQVIYTTYITIPS